MEYPIFDVPLIGGGMLIAKIAIFHVFIAHFSVGAGFFMVLAEKRAILDGNGGMMAFLKKYALLVLLVPYVLGTVTGVGIWFTIAVVSPRAISVLIHQFVWGWATEWVFFVIEVTAIYLYFYTWERVPAKVHNKIGWVFAIASLITLVIINGILGFMLTPGLWEPHGEWAFWKGLLNPSYFPTTIIRALVAFALAGVGAIALVTFTSPHDETIRKRVVSLAYKMIVPIALCVPLLGWTFLVLPERAQTFIEGGAPPMLLFLGFGVVSFGILTFSALLGMLRKDYTASTMGACMMCLLAFVGFGCFEFVREGIRKPYVIEGFMFSTGVTTAQAKEIDRRGNGKVVAAGGVLAAAPWALPPGKKRSDLDSEEQGAAVYRAACLRCHSVDGYNAIRPVLRSWSREMIRDLLDKMDHVRPAMPPFPGTDDEKGSLTEYLVSLNEK